MTTTEKLQRIKAKCEELLALAEKRTQGRWHYWNRPDNDLIATGKDEGKLICALAGMTSKPHDFAFIAACAGSAEAGWRAPIVTVDHILNGWLNDESGCDIITQNIIAAWEGLV